MLCNQRPQVGPFHRGDSNQGSHLSYGVWAFIICLYPRYRQIGYYGSPEMNLYGIFGITTKVLNRDFCLILLKNTSISLPFKNAVIPVFVSTRQRRVAQSVAKAKMIQHIGVDFRTQTNIAERVATSQLTVKKMEKMVVATQVFDMPVSFILLYELVKLITRYKLDDLGENVFALIHNPDVRLQQD